MQHNLNTQQSTKRNVAFALAISMAMLLAFEASAGQGGNFIKGLSDFISDALEGYVGTVIGLGGIAYGLIGGVARGSLAGFGTGVGLAIGSYYGPDIIKTLAGAII